MLSLSDQCVVDLKIAAGGRNWRCVAAEILEALAPVLSKDWRAYPRHLAGLLLGRRRRSSCQRSISRSMACRREGSR